MHELSRGERNSGPSRALHEPVNRLCVILPVIDHFVCPASRARQDLLSRNFLVNFKLEPPRGACGRYIQATDSPSRPLPALPGGDCSHHRKPQIAVQGSVAGRSMRVILAGQQAGAGSSGSFWGNVVAVLFCCTIGESDA